MAVGLELMLMACLMLVMLISDRAFSLMTAKRTLLQGNPAALDPLVASGGWIIFLMFFGLWSVSTVVRKWGWASKMELKPGIGIGFPLLMGISSLIVVMAVTT